MYAVYIVDKRGKVFLHLSKKIIPIKSILLGNSIAIDSYGITYSNSKENPSLESFRDKQYLFERLLWENDLIKSIYPYRNGNIFRIVKNLLPF